MKPSVIIDNEVYRKIMHWVNKSSHEVSGLGMVQCEEKGVLRVTHAMLLPQVNSGSSTDIEAEDAAKMQYLCKDMPGDLRFWWHSHVDFSVFWSGTDMDTQRKMAAGGWFLSTVFNKKREMRSAFLSCNGTETPWGRSELFLDDLATTVPSFIDPMAERWDAEYAENVKAREYHAHFQPVHWDHSAGRYSNRSVGGVAGEVLLLDKRPAGMTKREWKQLRKARKELTTIKPIVESTPTAPELDDYGYTSIERKDLAAQGWDIRDVDAMVQEDMTPSEIYYCAMNTNWTPAEVLQCLQQRMPPKDLIDHAIQTAVGDDIPVADRRHSNGTREESTFA